MNKLLNKLKYFSITVLEIRVGGHDFGRRHGVGINIMDFYLEVGSNGRGELGIYWGHCWFNGNMWYKPLHKAG